MEEYKFPTARLEGKGPFAVGVTLFLDRLSNRILTNSIYNNNNNYNYNTNNNNNNNYYNNNNRKVLLNLSGDEANLEELKLIDELWNLGKIVVVSNKIKNNRNNTNTNKFGDQIGIGSNGFSLQLQIKSSGGIVKIKSKNFKEIEEVSINEIGNRLKSIFEEFSEINCENNNNNIDEFDEYYESSQDYLIGSNNNNNNNNSSNNNNNNNIVESFNVHYLLSHKSEKNPILKEKALKAVRSLNPSKGEIIIHELPRDLLRKLLDKLNGNGILNPQSSLLNNNNNQTRNNNEEAFREQIGRLNQVLGKLGNKMVVFFNHKDNQIDLIFNK